MNLIALIDINMACPVPKVTKKGEGSALLENPGLAAKIVRACREKPRFDLIFVDPPTFSNSKAMGKNTWSVQRDHVMLLTHVVQLLAPGGEAVFSCNLRNFKPDYEALAAAGVAMEDITAQTIPYDFARNPKIHCCFKVRRA